jgi:hypothetical protein
MPRSLPPRPNLDQFRHQARDILNAHRRGDAAACPVLRLLPRFASASDSAILSAPLTLGNAQHALALDYGYASWRELKERVEKTAPPMRVAPPGRWFHGSNLELEVLRTGSTVTPIVELARAFACKPGNVSIEIRENGEEGLRRVSIRHDGRGAGYLYEVGVMDAAEDLRPHPASTMAPGEEMLTTHELAVHLIERVEAGEHAFQEFGEPLR